MMASSIDNGLQVFNYPWLTLRASSSICRTHLDDWTDLAVYLPQDASEATFRDNRRDRRSILAA